MRVGHSVARRLEQAAPPSRSGKGVLPPPVQPAELPTGSDRAEAPEAAWRPRPWARLLLGGVGALALFGGLPRVAPPPPAISRPASEDSLSARVRAAVDDIASREAAAGPWTSRDGNCLDLAAKWQSRLEAAGLPARLAVVDAGSQAAVLTVDGRAVPGKFHAFVVLEGGVLVDPSVQQFFGGPSERPDLPRIFVGTLEDAVGLFSRHPRDLRLEVAGDLHEGRYDPRDLAHLVYGAGPHAALRQVL